jgi:hypothetical protein
MSISLNEKKEIIRSLKAAAVEVTDPGDLPFTMIFNKSRSDELLAVVAPMNMRPGSVDHLIALGSIVMAFYPDFITILSEIHFQSIDGTTIEDIGQFKEELSHKYPPGYLQELSNTEGMYEAGLVTNGILCVTANRDSSLESFILPYSYHGKYGPYYFRWLDELEKHKPISTPNNENQLLISGDFYDKVRSLMKADRIRSDVVEKFMGGGNEEKLKKSAISYLQSMGFLVMSVSVSSPL